jgi:hypothetical protein
MSRSRRSDRESRILADLITDVCEDAEYEGVLSRQTVEDFYHLLAHNCGLTDLLHGKLQKSNQQVKEEVSERLSTKEPSAMTTKGVIVESYAGHTIPENELKTLLARYPNQFGYMTVDAGKLMIAGDNDPEELTFEKVNDYNQILKDHHVAWFFGRGEVKKEDIQPFVLCNDQGLPKICAFLEGDFTNFADANGRSDESNFIADYLQQKVDYLYELCGEDLEKTMSQFENKVTQREIVREVGDKGRAVIYFMSTTGAPILLQLNELSKNFDWGSVSDTSELTNATKIATTSVPAVGMSDTEKKIAALKAKRAAAAAEQPEGIHSTDATGKPLTQSPLQEDLKNAAALAKKENDLIFPPAEAFSTRDTLKKWLN